MSQISKIEYYGLGERIAKMLFGTPPKTYVQISEILLSEGIDIKKSSIAKFKKELLETTDEYLMQKSEYRERLAKTYLNTIDNLVYAMNEIKDKIELHRNDEEYKAHAEYTKMLLGEISMLLKRAGEIKPTQIIKEQNVIEINQAIQIQISDLIDDGDIPLDACSKKIQNWYRKHKKMGYA